MTAESEMKDGSSFVAKGSVYVRLRNFNPLNQSFSVDNKAVTEKAFEIGVFIDNLVSLPWAKQVRNAGSTTEKAYLQELTRGRREEKQSETSPPDESESCKNLKAILIQLSKYGGTSMKNILRQEFSLWQENTINQLGVNDVIGRLEKTEEAISRDVRIIEEERNKLAEVASSIEHDAYCLLDAENLALLSLAPTMAAESVRDRNEMKDNVKKLRNYLAGFDGTSDDPGDWIGNDYVYRLEKATFDTKREVTVTMAEREFKLEDKGFLGFKEKEGTRVSRKFYLRVYTWYVPEVGLAAVYSGVRYPKWGTKTVNGQTVVVKASDDPGTVDAALTLNFLLNIWGEAIAYPAAQLGVGTAKEAPSLLAGLGVRFVYPKPFAIMAGVIQTWGRDLNRLHEGDPVSGTAEIEQDLRLKALPLKGYIALQYNFE